MVIDAFFPRPSPLFTTPFAPGFAISVCELRFVNLPSSLKLGQFFYIPNASAVWTVLC